MQHQQRSGFLDREIYFDGGQCGCDSASYVAGIFGPDVSQTKLQLICWGLEYPSSLSVH